jgi:hypothetical protein
VTLDENPYAEPEWLRITRLTDAENLANARADWEEQEAAGSVEAAEAHWYGNDGRGGALLCQPWILRHQQWDGTT